MGFKGLMLGLLFTVLYASGAISMKFGLHSASPLTLATLRFVIAGLLLLSYIYILQKGKYRMPNKKEFSILFWLGLLNTTLFLGLGLVALQTVSSGIFNLFVPANALLYAFLASSVFRANHSTENVGRNGDLIHWTIHRFISITSRKSCYGWRNFIINVCHFVDGSRKSCIQESKFTATIHCY